jgi:hypothetical protein
MELVFQICDSYHTHDIHSLQYIILGCSFQRPSHHGLMFIYSSCALPIDIDMMYNAFSNFHP